MDSCFPAFLIPWALMAAPAPFGIKDEFNRLGPVHRLNQSDAVGTGSASRQARNGRQGREALERKPPTLDAASKLGKGTTEFGAAFAFFASFA